MQLSYDGTFTKKVIRTLQVVDCIIQWKEAGLTLAVLFERHGKNNNIGYGLIENGLISDGAIATTWSHDSHNLLVIGNDIQSMIKAQHRIVELQGGYCVVKKGNLVAELPLGIGGIVAEQPIVELAGQLAEVRKAIEELGYKNKNVIMSVSTLALVVSPELKLTDNGLFNVRTYEFEPLIINKA
jgi:adenine deaminase